MIRTIQRIEKKLKALVVFAFIQGVASLAFSYLLLTRLDLNGI
jgi:hypothetical protein